MLIEMSVNALDATFVNVYNLAIYINLTVHNINVA